MGIMFLFKSHDLETDQRTDWYKHDHFSTKMNLLKCFPDNFILKITFQNFCGISFYKPIFII